MLLMGSFIDKMWHMAKKCMKLANGPGYDAEQIRMI